MPDYDLDQRLNEVLAAHGATHCECGHQLTWPDFMWNNGETEAGTDCTVIEVQCSVCGVEINLIHRWGSIESSRELIDALDVDWDAWVQ